MAKITIYVPDHLKRAMDKMPAENWSAVAQDAFTKLIIDAPDRDAWQKDLSESSTKVELLELAANLQLEYVESCIRGIADSFRDYEQLKQKISEAKIDPKEKK